MTLAESPPSPSSPSIAEAKARLRAEIKARRDALPLAKRAAYSTGITQRLLQLHSYREARSVLTYMSFGSEFDTRALIEHALASGKEVLLPRVDRPARALKLHVVRDLTRDLQAGQWGILEPHPDRTQQTQVFDFKWILVPGLAFTHSGDRLGYGAGYYDRLIAQCGQQPTLVAAAFSVQIVERIPLTPYDKRVDQVVTEQGG